LDTLLWKRVFKYGFPILITGFAGWMNDSLNRVMFQKLSPATDTEALRQLGFYTAAVRLSIIINLFIQAFKMAAEPFFFSISKNADAQQSYARIMKWLVILLALMFLNIVLYLDLWKYFMGGNYREALGVVPILMLSYIFIGIYYNLTVWYKLTDQTHYGTYIVVCGSVITVIFNWLLIPILGYYACAWGTLLCNGAMMVLSYYWGQRFYPVPYDVPKLAKYLGLMLLLFFIQWCVNSATPLLIVRLLAATLLFAAYFFYIYRQERTELKGFPVIGKFIR
jgi:O-antigen/teichoic acid export membrane protein